MDKVRKNTLKVIFASGVRAPAHLDVIRFTANVLKIPAPEVHTIYKDENDRCFYIKFLDEPDFNCFVSGMEEQYRFEYGDGESTFVKLEVASRLFRYVRIFNLPPEVDDKDIAAALGQFGTIRQHVRERYPADYGYAVFSGIRGVHMEISKEIPANLYISHFKARLYYEGLKNRCFFCKQEGHLKAECPKAKNVKVTASTGSYSGIVTGALMNNMSKARDDSSQLNMTPLQSKNSGTASKTNDQLVTQPGTSAGTSAKTRIASSTESTHQKIGDGGENMDATDTIATQKRTITDTSQSDGGDGDVGGNGGSTSKVSPRRGRSRSKKQTVERKMEQLLLQLSGRSRSRSKGKREGKSEGKESGGRA